LRAFRVAERYAFGERGRLRKPLLSLTEGVTVRICRLLEIAAVRALESGRERIETDLLNAQ
jgi:hypothetical protein